MQSTQLHRLKGYSLAEDRRILSGKERGRTMLRRDFLRRSARTIGATLLAKNAVARAALTDPDSLPHKFNAQDEIVLGRTGIRTSRLAMGTGTIGYGGTRIRQD